MPPQVASMKFGPVPIQEAKDAIAAHSVRFEGGMIRKGAVVTAMDMAALEASGIAEIVVARLEAGDLGENEAATQLARQIAGKGLQADAAFTGRVNVFAQEPGLLCIDGAAILRLNSADEAITLATLPAFRAVVAGEMVATVKIIPYGVPERILAEVLAGFGGNPPLQLAPYSRNRVGVISTTLPGLKPAVVDKTLKVMAERLAPAGAAIHADLRVVHEILPLSNALRQRAASADEIIIIFGASAITDRRDVIPAALVEAGGKVTHLGMPVDPGNLIMLGEIGGKPVIGAPGCARSPKENGFDWVLQRLLANLAVTRADIQAMGVGGLLMEIISRPQPRVAPARPRMVGKRAGLSPVAAIVLAAGRSTRMGPRNKLLEMLHGKPLIRHAAEAAIASQAHPVIVVTGHGATDVEAALSGLDVRLVHNAGYQSGMASSLKAGIAALPGEAAGALILLGDMPHVTAAIANRLLAHFAENTAVAAVIPTLLGQRGNPVLLARGLFAAMSGLEGDEGARRLLTDAGDKVIELPLDDPAIALDIDTPEGLEALRQA